MNRSGAVPGPSDHPPGPSEQSGPTGPLGGSPEADPSGRTASTGHAVVEPLVGAWLLHACSPEEAAMVEAHLRHCESCTSEANVLHAAAASLGTETADEAPPVVPPRGLYERVTAASFTRRAPTPRGLPAFVRPYAAQHATLDALLRELSADDWRVETVEGWSAAQLVAHLAATDGLLAERVGGERIAAAGSASEAGGSADAGGGSAGVVDGPDDGAEATVPGRTAAYTAWAAEVPPGAVHALWRAQGQALRAALAGGGPEVGERLVELHGRMPFPLADHSLGRAFETWVHSTDIALRTGYTLPPPVPESLGPIADLGVRLLPLAAQLRGVPLGDRVLRLELTGPGGGIWRVGEVGAVPDTDAVGGGRGPDADVALKTVEFCFLAGARRDPERVLATAARVTGDRELARDVLVAAPAFAGP
ncbi:maleylpyruvate isomerase N-terminal domain-containing protein [Streptomyces sp. NPDC003077]|uniref:zf-HC2 domain-containing protein n=1 Tax=Streptomyces sp. NPDC003077 TaxID=3154443 RepID=UPI0033A8C938